MTTLFVIGLVVQVGDFIKIVPKGLCSHNFHKIRFPFHDRRKILRGYYSRVTPSVFEAIAEEKGVFDD